MELVYIVFGVTGLLIVLRSLIKHLVNRIETKRYNEVERISKELKESFKHKNKPENERDNKEPTK